MGTGARRSDGPSERHSTSVRYSRAAGSTPRPPAALLA
jgi:hypothetical protein